MLFMPKLLVRLVLLVQLVHRALLEMTVQQDRRELQETMVLVVQQAHKAQREQTV